MFPFTMCCLIEFEPNFPFTSIFQAQEDVGDVFQDQANMAAILMRKHLQSGDLMMVSSSLIR